MGAGREVPTLSASKILFGHLGYGVLQIHYPKLGKNGWEQARKMGGERETVLGLCKPWDFFIPFWSRIPSINASSHIPHLLYKHPVIVEKPV